MAGKRKRTDAKVAGASAAAAAASGNGSAHKGGNINKKQKKAHVAAKSVKATAASNGKKSAKVSPPVTVAVVANSNWLALKAKIQRKDSKHQGQSEGDAPHKKRDLDVNAQRERAKQQKQAKRQAAKASEWIDNSLIVGMDCEMVGVGLSGKTSVLARCSIVDYDGNVLYDKHVRPVEKVTDFRTHVSGIRSRSLKKAIPFAQCLKEVGKLLDGKIIVGHALKNDFSALMFTPPKHLVRDTAHYRPYMRRKKNGTKLFPKSLKHLAEEVLGKQIQGGEHDSVEDARATLELYKREQYAWEKYLRTNKTPGSLVGIAPPLPKARDDADYSKPATVGDSEDEDAAPSTAAVIIPDAKELAIMEYGE